MQDVDQEEKASMGSIGIPVGGQTVNISLEAGSTLFIVGKNGSGKSALVHYVATRGLERLRYIPGSRSNTFDTDQIGLTANARDSLESNLQSWDQQPYGRYNPQRSTNRNERALFDLHERQVSHLLEAAEAIRSHEDPSTHVAALRDGLTPLERLNAILSQAALPIQLVIQQARLLASRGNDTFSFAWMSDGERSAVILAADVLAAAPGTIFLIDEPEVHLHKSIVTPLITALIVERRDCAFVVSTHELDLPAAFSGSRIVLVRSVTWSGQQPIEWKVDVLEDVSLLPESVRNDVLGARRRMLFVEGIATTLDQPIYALLFPQVSVHARSTCRRVKEVVAGLRAETATHRVEAFGLVDNDGMVPADGKGGVYSTAAYAVESLYYCQPSIRAVAEAMASVSGLTTDDLIAQANSAALQCLKNAQPQIGHLAARLSERRLRDKLEESFPSHRDIATMGAEFSITVQSPYPAELERLKGLVDADDISRVVREYPIRETGVLKAIAQALRLPGTKDYERVLLQQVRRYPELRKAIKAELGQISDVLESADEPPIDLAVKEEVA